MIDDRWTPLQWPRYPKPSPASSRGRRAGLTDSERLLALEIADEHHEELHRQAAHRFEIGDQRMGQIESRIERVRREQLAEREAREARAEEKARFRASRNQAIQTVVWIMAILTGTITIWNFAARPPHSTPSYAVTAPAPR